jgi:hypothetical protein
MGIILLVPLDAAELLSADLDLMDPAGQLCNIVFP